MSTRDKNIVQAGGKTVIMLGRQVLCFEPDGVVRNDANDVDGFDDDDDDYYKDDNGDNGNDDNYDHDESSHENVAFYHPFLWSRPWCISHLAESIPVDKVPRTLWRLSTKISIHG